MNYPLHPIINQIENHNLIPVIGNDLSVILLKKEELEAEPKLKEIVLFDEDNKHAVNLYPWLAFQLYNDYKIESEIDPFCLNDIVIELLSNEQYPMGINELNVTIANKIQNLSNDQINLQAYEKLARIQGIDAYITVNIDGFLERAFKQQSLGCNKSINFAIPSNAIDPSKVTDAKLPTIFNLFGTIAESNFAISDEEYIEYLYQLREENKPFVEQFLNAIKGKSLLMIGCSFPNWLMRFFIRIVTGERLRDNKIGRTVASDTLLDQRELYSFLQQNKVKVIPIDPQGEQGNMFKNSLDFINTLCDKWQETTNNVRNEIKYKEKLFISYSRKDKGFIEEVKNEFVRQGVNVFFDETDIKGGKITPIIKQNISNCDYFLAFISGHSLDKEKYAYDKEWRRAIILNEDADDPEISNLCPYIIDQTIQMDDERIPEEFRAVLMHKLTEKNAIPEVINKFIIDRKLTKIA